MQSLLNELREIDENLMHKAFEWPEEVQAKKRKQEILRELNYIPKGPGQPKKELRHNVALNQSSVAKSFNESPRHLQRDIELANAIEKEPELAQIKSKTQAYRKVKLEEKHKNFIERPLPKGKWQVILADPPWKFENTGFDQSADSHYPTMDLTQICDQPIQNRCLNTSVLFLWAVNALLPEALQVMRAWGFTYKTNRAWIKHKGPTIGWFSNSKHELLLVGVKPETPHPLIKYDSIFEYEPSKHSKKPIEVYREIQQMYPGPLDKTFYLEWFARETPEGWESWGNE
jgi:N6-adenosine-specific RNA methylase IME4